MDGLRWSCVQETGSSISFLTLRSSLFFCVRVETCTKMPKMREATSVMNPSTQARLVGPSSWKQSASDFGVTWVTSISGMLRPGHTFERCRLRKFILLRPELEGGREEKEEEESALHE
jgi:hypothetical protein